MLDQCGDLLPSLPTATRAALLASLRRRAAAFDCLAGDDACSEIDRCVLALTSENQTVLDLAGQHMSDAAALALAPRLTRVRALDVRRCPLLTGECHRATASHCSSFAYLQCKLQHVTSTAQGLRLLLTQATELRVLRWGA